MKRTRAKEVWLSVWNEFRLAIGDKLLLWTIKAYPPKSHEKIRLTLFAKEAIETDLAELAKDPEIAEIIRKEQIKRA